MSVIYASNILINELYWFLIKDILFSYNKKKDLRVFTRFQDIKNCVKPLEKWFRGFGEGTLPWAIYRFRIFSNYSSQKFLKIKITVWKSGNLIMYGNFCLDLY